MKTYIVDAFTSEPFKGNPAGICFPENELSDQQMLSIAKELGFSETAFVSNGENNGHYDIRFFTPQSEIALCGHATLGSAKVMFATTNLAEVHFLNIDKLDLVARKDGAKVVMEFPVYHVVPAQPSEALLKALSIPAILNCTRCNELDILILEMESSSTLKELNPDYATLLKSYTGINGVIVTARAEDAKFDFVYRYFWPWKGTNEDPVTGGAQTFLAKYWGNKLHKKKMRVLQASPRTGQMEVELIDNDTHVLIKGNAVIVLAGDMRI